MKRVIIFIIFFFPAIVFADSVSVSSFDELKIAVENGETDISITNDMYFDGVITISKDVVIDGNNNNLNRKVGYTGKLFAISTLGTLYLENIKMDLGASGWYMDYDNRYYTKADNKGYIRVPIIDGIDDNIAEASLITNSGNLNLKNVEIRNGRSVVSGTVISGAGNNNLKDVTLEHVFSSKNGAMIYVSGGNTLIDGIVAKEGVSGLPTTSGHGAVLYIIDGAKLDIKNALIQDNFAQGNSSIFISKTNTTIDNITFKHNMSGNDGSALNLESSVSGKTFSLTNGVFEDNIGFAQTAQSMGTIWISKWISTPEQPLVFKNVVFKNNINRCGGGFADNGDSVTFVSIENAESYGNTSDMQSGSFIYGQTAGYTIKNLKVHDNNIASGGAIYSLVSPLKIIDSEFYNNKVKKDGGAIFASGGDVEIINSVIYNNSADSQGGGIFYRGYYDDYPISLTIVETIIKDNKASEGGGIGIVDHEGFYTDVLIDDKTKIYDNAATISGDDFQYKRNDESENTTQNSITLTNISIAGIDGIDGWYVDGIDNRFVYVDNPEKFNSYVDYKGTLISLKAAGINVIDYNLDGGINDEIEMVTIKYGVETKISDDVPKKDGYIFTGWNTKVDGSGVEVKPGSTYNGKGGLLLYAQYKKEKDVIKDDLMSPETSDFIYVSIFILVLSFIGIVMSIKMFKRVS